MPNLLVFHHLSGRRCTTHQVKTPSFLSSEFCHMRCHMWHHTPCFTTIIFCSGHAHAACVLLYSLVIYQLWICNSEGWVRSKSNVLGTMRFPCEKIVLMRSNGFFRDKHTSPLMLDNTLHTCTTHYLQSWYFGDWFNTHWCIV